MITDLLKPKKIQEERIIIGVCTGTIFALASLSAMALLRHHTRQIEHHIEPKWIEMGVYNPTTY